MPNQYRQSSLSKLSIEKQLLVKSKNYLDLYDRIRYQ